MSAWVMGPDRGKFLCVREESAWYSRRTIAHGGHMSGIRTEAGAHPLSLCALMYYIITHEIAALIPVFPTAYIAGRCLQITEDLQLLAWP